MSNETKVSIAAKAVACKGWRWMPGMVTLRTPDGCFWRMTEDDDASDIGRALPDFDDPATLGCLLALVREAWRFSRASVVWFNDRDRRAKGWRCEVETPTGIGTRISRFDGATEAEALVAALEAAP